MITDKARNKWRWEDLFVAAKISNPLQLPWRKMTSFYNYVNGFDLRGRDRRENNSLRMKKVEVGLMVRKERKKFEVTMREIAVVNA